MSRMTKAISQAQHVDLVPEPRLKLERLYVYEKFEGPSWDIYRTQ